MQSSCLSFGKSVRVCSLILFVCAIGPLAGGTKAQTAPDPWDKWQFILGDWGSGPDAKGVEGGTSFNLDLDRKVLVRKNFANYPATNGKPAINHKDLMVVHLNGAAPAEANYWDNEGHTIHYFARISDAADTVQFTSDIIKDTPRFRLSYAKLAIDSVRVIFEAAPPGSPDAFSPYVAGVIHRK